MSENDFRENSERDFAPRIIDSSELVFSEKGEHELTDVKLNTILYGPPGTGKTYHTVIYAVAVIENKPLKSVEHEDYAAVFERYNQYKAQGRIEFITFHQSYGYEEFIEGIKPVLSSADETSGEPGDIRYRIQPGVFKHFCEKAGTSGSSAGDFGINDSPNIWKVSLEGTGENLTRTECMKKNHIRIGWDEYGKYITDKTEFKSGGKGILNAFINRMQPGDIVLSCYSASTIDAVGVVTGEYEWHEEYSDYRRLRKVKWIVKGIRENILDINGGIIMTLATVYRMANVTLADVYHIIEKYKPELITLVEDGKREGQTEGMKAVLPYSQKPFGVPENVYIIGTMNTADRSIAAIDTALRRRFFFREMLPDASVLSDIFVEDICISELFIRMNQRIAVLYDSEHTIGHAYFIPLKNSPTIDTLAEVFSNRIIPLLQEYFYEDYEKIRLVLGDNKKSERDIQFVWVKTNDYAMLFGAEEIDMDQSSRYEINKNAFSQIEAYRSI